MVSPRKILKFPILIVVVVVILLFFSPFLLSWITKTILATINGNQVSVTWINSADQISSSSHLQFLLSDEFEPDELIKSFFIEPETSGNWYWLEQDLVVWAPEKPIPSGQLIKFGFQNPNDIDLAGSGKLKEIQWQAYVREPEIVFMKGVETGKELYKLELEQPGLEIPLTQTNGMVFDFSISPDGEQILYSKGNEQSGIDLWTMNRDGQSQIMILDCGKDRCTAPDWNPVRDEIVFLIEKSIPESSAWDLPRPHLLNLVTGLVSPLFKDPAQVGYDPVWSSKGQWVSVWQGNAGGILIVQATSKEIGYADPYSEDTGCWSPEERYFYYSNVKQEGLPIVSIIYKVEILSGLRDYFTGSALFNLGYNYYYPVCHPQGYGILAAVQVDPKIPQREIWWIQADETYQKIYTDLSQMVTQFSWNPSGTRVLFLRDTLTGLQDGSKIVLWTENSGDAVQEFSDNVYKVRWLP